MNQKIAKAKILAMIAAGSNSISLGEMRGIYSASKSKSVLLEENLGNMTGALHLIIDKYQEELTQSKIYNLPERNLNIIYSCLLLLLITPNEKHKLQCRSLIATYTRICNEKKIPIPLHPHITFFPRIKRYINSAECWLKEFNQVLSEPQSDVTNLPTPPTITKRFSLDEKETKQLQASGIDVFNHYNKIKQQAQRITHIVTAYTAKQTAANLIKANLDQRIQAAQAPLLNGAKDLNPLVVPGLESAEAKADTERQTVLKQKYQTALDTQYKQDHALLEFFNQNFANFVKVEEAIQQLFAKRLAILNRAVNDIPGTETLDELKEMHNDVIEKSSGLEQKLVADHIINYFYVLQSGLGHTFGDDLSLLTCDVGDQIMSYVRKIYTTRLQPFLAQQTQLHLQQINQTKETFKKSFNEREQYLIIQLQQLTRVRNQLAQSAAKPLYNSLGASFFGTKPPTGFAELRRLLAQNSDDSDVKTLKVQLINVQTIIKVRLGKAVAERYFKPRGRHDAIQHYYETSLILLNTLFNTAPTAELEGGAVNESPPHPQ